MIYQSSFTELFFTKKRNWFKNNDLSEHKYQIQESLVFNSFNRLLIGILLVLTLVIAMHSI